MQAIIRRATALVGGALFVGALVAATAPPAAAAGVSDFGATFIESADPITTDESVTYTVTVLNAGPDTGQLGEIEFQTSTSAATVTTSTVGCVVDDLTIECQPLLLKPGESRNFTYTVTPSGPGTLNTAALLTADSTTTDPDLSNNTVIESTTVTAAPQEADIAVALDASAGPLLTSQITYSLTVANTGPGDVADATVVVDLPSQVSSATSVPAGCTYSGANDTVTCDTGAIANGDQFSGTFRANLGLLSIGQLPASATRTASTPTDPNPTNDTSDANCSTLTSLLISCS